MEADPGPVDQVSDPFGSELACLKPGVRDGRNALARSVALLEEVLP
jgi:hypothetical protein